MHEGVRDVAALVAGRQLAGNATRTVPVERCADELLVARALEHLLERALPHLERADEGFKLLKICAENNPMLTWEDLMSTYMGFPMSTWHFFPNMAF